MSTVNIFQLPAVSLWKSNRYDQSRDNLAACHEPPTMARKTACRARASPAVPRGFGCPEEIRESRGCQEPSRARTRKLRVSDIWSEVSQSQSRFSRAAQWSTEAAGENQEALSRPWAGDRITRIRLGKEGLSLSDTPRYA